MSTTFQNISAALFGDAQIKKARNMYLKNTPHISLALLICLSLMDLINQPPDHILFFFQSLRDLRDGLPLGQLLLDQFF